MLEGLQEFTASLPTATGWLGLILFSVMPIVETYFGAGLSLLAG